MHALFAASIFNLARCRCMEGLHIREPRSYSIPWPQIWALGLQMSDRSRLLCTRNKAGHSFATFPKQLADGAHTSCATAGCKTACQRICACAAPAGAAGPSLMSTVRLHYQTKASGSQKSACASPRLQSSDAGDLHKEVDGPQRSRSNLLPRARSCHTKVLGPGKKANMARIA